MSTSTTSADRTTGMGQASVGPVVVGTDGSACAASAVRWAAYEAAQRGADLHLVNVSALSAMFAAQPGYPPYVRDLERYRRAAGQVVATAADEVGRELRESAPGTEQLVVSGSAVEGLVKASEEASLLVVGSRGLGAVSRLVQGSVSTGCLHHAEIPVAVIGEHHQLPGTGPVVVGIDGTDSSRPALRWAAAEAARWEVGLVLVHGWAASNSVPLGTGMPGAQPEQFVARGVSMLREFAAEVLAGQPASTSVEFRAVSDPAAPALLEVATELGGSVMVLGASGRGALSGLLLGSVRSRCARDADRPFVLVRPPVVS